MAVFGCLQGLEGIIDYCMGCVIFGYLITFNIVPKAIYRSYLNFLPSRQWAWEYVNHDPPNRYIQYDVYIIMI